MTFIDAITVICRFSELTLCTNDEERSGLRPVCVYRNGEFIGKLRWPTADEPASVDEELESVLKAYRVM